MRLSHGEIVEVVGHGHQWNRWLTDHPELAGE